MSRDSYQRGARDALLDAAVQLDARAEEADKEAAWWHERRPLTPEATLWAAREAAFREAAALARRLSEAMPEDPEGPTP